MAKPTDRNSEPAYDLVQRWLRDVLPNESTFFEPRASIWAPAHLEELVSGFINRSDVGTGTFTEKLAAQLAEVSDDAVRLMAEVETVSYLIHWTGAIGQKRKLEIIGETLRLRDLDAVVPPGVQEALAPGFCHPGRHLSNSPNLFFAWYIRFAKEWQSLSQEERDRALADPWEFKGITARIDGDDGVAMALRHLAHPDTFDPIVTAKDMEAIVDRWPSATRPADLDRALLEVRLGLTPTWGQDFNWYDHPLRHLWNPGDKWSSFTTWGRRLAEAVDLDNLERDFKLELAEKAMPVIETVRAGRDEWAQSFRSVWLNRNNNLVDFRVRDDFIKWVEGDTEASGGLLRLVWADRPELSKVMALWPEAVPGSTGVRLNIVSTLLMLKEPAHHPPVKIRALKKAFELAGWSMPDDRDDPVQLLEWAYLFFDEIVQSLRSAGVELRDRLDAQGLFWTLLTLDRRPNGWSSEEWTAFQVFQDGGAEGPLTDTPVPSTDSTDITNYLAAASRDLSVEQEYLEEMYDRLRRKGQIVLYGPPGTGKTFFAKRFAQAVARDHPGGVRIVQFHPSTSYEDFVEGIRPKTVDGELRYELVDGPLRRLAHEADQHRGQDFVLLIDELNRANLPRVFGELLYLMEYRESKSEQGVYLLYRPDETFVLPPNLYIVATMNTADRSVALIDAALRRRFAFLPFFPDRPPVKDMLRTWLSEQEDALPVADFLEAVNDELARVLPRSLLLGPSYVMGDAAKSLTDLEKSWTYGVYPTLEELFWGNEEELENWSWSNVRRRFATQLGLPVETDDVLDDESTRAPG